MKTVKSKWMGAMLAMALVCLIGKAGVPEAMAMQLGPKQKVEQTNQKAVEDVNLTSRDKLHRVVEGEKTPIRPVTVVPPANLNIKGDSNTIHFEKPPEPQDTRTPEEIYADYKAWRAYQHSPLVAPPGWRPVDPPAAGARQAYHEETDYESGASAGATSDKVESSYTKWSIPLGWNLCLLGIGLCIVIYAVRYGLTAAKAGSASFNEFYNSADTLLANWIREHRSAATKSTDPAVIAANQTDAAELEAARAQLLAKATSLSGTAPTK